MVVVIPVVAGRADTSRSVVFAERVLDLRDDAAGAGEGVTRIAGSTPSYVVVAITEGVDWNTLAVTVEVISLRAVLADSILILCAVGIPVDNLA